MPAADSIDTASPLKLIPRHLAPLLDISLQDTPAVLVNGPRQCGKTTLVQQFSKNMDYFTLDDPNLLAAVQRDQHLSQLPHLLAVASEHTGQLLNVAQIGGQLGLKRLKALVGDAFVTGLLLYDGAQALPFGDGLWAVPLAAL